MRNAGRVLTRGQLIDRVWGSDYFGDTKTLDVHIKRIRSKIEVTPSEPVQLVTVRGLGLSLRGRSRRGADETTRADVVARAAASVRGSIDGTSRRSSIGDEVLVLGGGPRRAPVPGSPRPFGAVLEVHATRSPTSAPRFSMSRGSSSAAPSDTVSPASTSTSKVSPLSTTWISRVASSRGVGDRGDEVPSSPSSLTMRTLRRSSAPRSAETPSLGSYFSVVAR